MISAHHCDWADRCMEAAVALSIWEEAPHLTLFGLYGSGKYKSRTRNTQERERGDLRAITCCMYLTAANFGRGKGVGRMTYNKHKDWSMLARRRSGYAPGASDLARVKTSEELA